MSDFLGASPSADTKAMADAMPEMIAALHRMPIKLRIRLLLIVLCHEICKAWPVSGRRQILAVVIRALPGLLDRLEENMRQRVLADTKEGKR